MKTSTVKSLKQVGVKALRVTKSTLRIWLNDGREIGIPIQEMPDLHWLVTAKPKQRAHWLLERGGEVIFWPQMKGRVEISRLLDPQPIA